MKGLGGRTSQFIKSPLSRISFGLVMLTVSLLLIADFIGFMPDARSNEVSFRKHIAESTAIQVSMEIGERSTSKLEQILQSSVDRNDRIVSAAVRRIDGTLLHDTSDHKNNWTLAPGANSTIEQIHVALFSPEGEWGRFELVFNEMPTSTSIFKGGSSVVKLILYVALAGFLAYFLFLRKVMRELNPDQVLPDRVRNALDSLSDGLLVLNDDGVIMFCNQALADRVGISASKLTGKECSSLDWVNVNEAYALPWNSVLDGDESRVERAVNLRVGSNQHYKYIVNASIIAGEGGDVRGALVTFNDITELEKKHAELEIAVEQLKESQNEIEQKNRELYTMATRDPLTNLFNRRAFFEAFDILFEQAKENRSRLGCIMLDIDHFKSVNDTHGHGVGDIVIKYMADSLTEFMSDVDVVGRFGGEEFCLLLPDATVDEAIQRANNIRKYIEAGTGSDFPVELSITSSFGVSVLPSEAQTPNELVEHADLALYEAKTSGRNVVKAWDGEQTKQNTQKNMAAELTKKNVRSSNSGSVDKSEEGDSPGAMVLVEAGKKLTQRQLLTSNIENAINRAKRQGSNMAVVVLDGSSLQYIANNVDYSIGNQLCTALVDRLKHVLRLNDVVSQGELDGSASSVTQTEQYEIAVLLSDVENREAMIVIVERLLAAFDERVVINNQEYMINTHAGIAMIGEGGEEAADLLQNAVIACSHCVVSKDKAYYSFYTADLRDAVKRRLQLQSDLYQAAQRNELEVVFQPKLCIVKGEILGFEALLRWNHSKLGLIRPDEFIPIAEKTGLIQSINKWVITSIAEQHKRWQESGLTVPSVAVNVSALELKEDGFASGVLGILDEAGLDYGSLEIEITESIAIEELEAARKNLERLEAAGLVISVDDFGTGYSSMGYLQHFPISRLKIDRMFIDGCTVDERKAQVVRSIISMGTSLGLRVLAEGVETQAQLLFLRNHHCHEIQGYFVSTPVDAAQTGKYLADPSQLSQKVIAASMGSRQLGKGVKTMPMTGFDSVISRFPEAANELGAAEDEQEGRSR